MLNIKQIILLTLASFGYPVSHCLYSYKTCSLFVQTTIPNCILQDQSGCFQCEENYSLYDDGTCINIPNCLVFDAEKKCQMCTYYYNFDSNGNCVKDYCESYDGNKNCIQCFPRFQLNSEHKCEKINIDYCTHAEGNTCDECKEGTKIINGNCIVQNLIEGCQSYNEDETACLTCDQNYKLENGKCTFNLQCQAGTFEACFFCDEDYYSDPFTYQCKRYDGMSENPNTNTDNGNSDSNSDSNNAGNNDSNIASNNNSNNASNYDNKAERIKFNIGLIYLLLVLL